MKSSENSTQHSVSHALAVDRAALFDACARNAENIHEIACFKNWIRICVRPLLPHGALACVHGRTYGVGVSLDYVVTVDYPVEHLQAIRNSSGHMDTPSCIATYFSFHRLPTLNETVLCDTFETLTPLLHETFTRVVRTHKESTAAVAYNYNLLTGREQEIATCISQGKSNGDIAQLLGVSENTIRNHVSRILDRTGCNNRAGLATAVILQEQNRFGMGTKVL